MCYFFFNEEEEARWRRDGMLCKPCVGSGVHYSSREESLAVRSPLPLGTWRESSAAHVGADASSGCHGTLGAGRGLQTPVQMATWGSFSGARVLFLHACALRGTTRGIPSE